jgi:hypothetical protein
MHSPLRSFGNWRPIAFSAAMAVPLLVAGCRPAAPPAGGTAAPAGAKPATTPAAKGTGAPASYDRVDNAIATDRSGSGGTLIIGMSAGNIPYPNTPPNEGYEGTRFVGNQIYDELTPVNYDQGDSVPVPGPGLATDCTSCTEGLSDMPTSTFSERRRNTSRPA